MVAGVLLAVFAVASLISDRVMPIMGESGIAMVLCTGDGVVEIRIDPETGEPLESDPDSLSICDWAAAKPVLALKAGLQDILPIRRATGAGALPANSALLFSRATGLPPSTGPPFAI